MSTLKTFKKKRLLFIKTFPDGGLNNIYEDLIIHLSSKKKYQVITLVFDYREMGVDLPITKNDYLLLRLPTFPKMPFKSARQLHFFFKIQSISQKINEVISTISPHTTIWSQDAIFHIPLIPKISNTHQIFLFQEWLREKYESKSFYYSFKHPKRSLWNAIRSLILDKNKTFLSHVNTVVFHTSRMRTLYEKANYPLKHFQVIPLGVDSVKFSNLNTDKNISSRQLRILYIGPLADFKGSNLMINALRLLAKRRKIVFQNIYYKKGRDFQKTKKRLKHESIPFEFFENIPDTQKIRLINEADLILHVPFYEPYGLTVLEALSCGTKVIAYKNVGVLEHFKIRQPGLFVLNKYKDIELARLIEKAIGTNVDSKSIRKIFLKQGLSNKNFISQFETLL